jgi:xylulokinase
VSTPLLIGVDLGTTGCRTIVFDRSGRVLAKAYVEYEVQVPEPGWAEQDPDKWWESAVHTMRDAVAATQIRPEDVAAIGVTGQQPCPVFVDREGRALAPSLIWMDRRTTAECDEIAEALGSERVYEVTGLRVDPNYSATKILWVRKHWPDVYSRTHKILPAKDFVLHRLTGQFVTDHATSGASLLYDIQELEWWEEALRVLDISKDKLPTPRASTDWAGPLLQPVAEEVGLLPGTPVFTCAGDATTAAVGCRAVVPGETCAVIGTACDVITCTETPLADPQQRFGTYPHAVAGRYVIMAGANTGAASLRWFRDQFCDAEVESASRLRLSPYALMDLEAARSRPGAGGITFLPYLMGERSPIYDPLARGSFFGVSLRHTRDDFIRSILEGVAYSIHHRLTMIEEQGVDVPLLYVAGGGAKSALWRQIVADVTGKPILVLEAEESTCLAAAILAGTGAGVYHSVESACAELLPVAGCCEPQTELRSLYDNGFDVYTKLYEYTKPLLQAVDSIARH